jgi:hypothetical protein
VNKKNKNHLIKVLGLVGAGLCLAIFAIRPSFPTPDKLFIFLFFIFLIFEQASEFIKRLAPFVVLILVYESFRGLADQLNKNVNYFLAPQFDKFIFGALPTITLQKYLWHGTLQWYDYLFYSAYLMHFILPFGLAILIWKYRERYYWRYLGTFLAVSFAAFIVFLLFPAAPPWMASQSHVIPHVTRISSNVWAAMGLNDFPSFYSKISPNSVAAVPSLHAAWAVLFSLFIFKLFGKALGFISMVYPALIIIGTVYMGEHYVFDALTGALLAGFAFWAINFEFFKWPKLKINTKSKVHRKVLKRA